MYEVEVPLGSRRFGTSPEDCRFSAGYTGVTHWAGQEILGWRNDSEGWFTGPVPEDVRYLRLAGRPKDKTAQFIFRMTYEERDLIAERARAEGVSVNEYITRRVLG